MNQANPKYTKRKFDENKHPFGKDNCSATFRTHPFYYQLFSDLAMENRCKKYGFFNRFCRKYLLEEISKVKDGEQKIKLLNKLNKVPII